MAEHRGGEASDERGRVGGVAYNVCVCGGGGGAGGTGQG